MRYGSWTSDSDTTLSTSKKVNGPRSSLYWTSIVPRSWKCLWVTDNRSLRQSCPSASRWETPKFRPSQMTKSRPLKSFPWWSSNLRFKWPKPRSSSHHRRTSKLRSWGLTTKYWCSVLESTRKPRRGRRTCAKSMKQSNSSTSMSLRRLRSKSAQFQSCSRTWSKKTKMRLTCKLWLSSWPQR